MTCSSMYRLMPGTLDGACGYEGTDIRGGAGRGTGEQRPHGMSGWFGSRHQGLTAQELATEPAADVCSPSGPWRLPIAQQHQHQHQPHAPPQAQDRCIEKRASAFRHGQGAQPAKAALLHHPQTFEKSGIDLLTSGVKVHSRSSSYSFCARTSCRRAARSCSGAGEAAGGEAGLQWAQGTGAGRSMKERRVRSG